MVPSSINPSVRIEILFFGENCSVLSVNCSPLRGPISLLFAFNGINTKNILHRDDIYAT